MIIQGLLNIIRDAVLAILTGLPPVPSEFLTVLDAIAAGGAWVSDLVQNLGMIVPFAAVSWCLALWAAAMVFWLAIFGLRLALWLFGR